MKIGKLTKLSNVTFTSTPAVDTGKDAVNILSNDVLKVWGVTGGVSSLVVQFDPVQVDAVALFNITVRSSVTINTYTEYPAQKASSVTIKATDLTGFYTKNTFTDISGSTSAGFILDNFILDNFILGGAVSENISAIEIITNGASDSFKTSIGYLWAGDLINFDCTENIQPFDESTDDVTVSRTNHPDINDRYEFTSYNVTLKKENGFNELRENMREIFSTGFGTPRPIIFDEPFWPNTPEIILGILDAPKVGYDLITSDDTAAPLAQATIGIREVY